MEVWKTIIGFDNYQISSLGNVRKTDSLKPFSLIVNNNTKPYYRVGLSKNGKRYFFLVHRLVAEHFIPKIEGKDLVNHIDYNKQNNHIENLEWCTNKENTRYSRKNTIIQKSNGLVVKIWDSLYQITDTGLYNPSKVSECYNGKRGTHKNFTWHLQ